MIQRIYVRKKKEYRQAEERLKLKLEEIIKGKIESAGIYNRYEVEGITEEEFVKATATIFSEPPVDNIYKDAPKGNIIIGVETLPEQFDQRADSAKQCVTVLTGKDDVAVRYAAIYALCGNFKKGDREKIVKFLINPAECKEVDLGISEDFEIKESEEKTSSVIEGFTFMSSGELQTLGENLNLVMNIGDLKFIAEYFKSREHRDPTITELLILDTFWSDHIRHTTFKTNVKNIEIQDGKYTQPVKEAFDAYLDMQEEVYGKNRKHPITFMDMATLPMKALQKEGKLERLEITKEVNAAGIRTDVEVDGKNEKWIMFFKNETHNHLTEIDPFGGAATCLGGCIRDPLSGRAYVYQAMRVSGAGDPHAPFEKTLEGKLPQMKIVTESAKGFSSYGNQIGITAGQAQEYYHDGFIAKRLEAGAVIAATKEKDIIFEKPKEGDLVILLGGRTGRDGMGGATGSSAKRDSKKIKDFSSQVQKGNPLTERKIQCLFRRKEVTKLIKKCNDFGGGGIAVAVGELADGVYINLDMVQKKYEGLSGTELALSESQERMAVVVDRKNAQQFIKYAGEENLEASVIAEITDSHRLVIHMKGEIIADLSKDFINTSGTRYCRNAKIIDAKENGYFKTKNIEDIKKTWIDSMSELNNASQQGMAEHFDSTIGANTVIMPFGGKYQKTPADGSIVKIPLVKGTTDTASYMTHGYDPYLASWSPFHGAAYAILLALTKLTTLGSNWRNAHLTLQEYFKKLTSEQDWGTPAAALLGAFYMEKELGIASLGGKDSMSGTYDDIHVPPTLIAFAVNIGKASEAVTQEIKKEGNALVLFKQTRKQDEMPDLEIFKKHADFIYKEVQKGNIQSMKAVDAGGIAVTLAKMAFGNRIGAKLTDEIKAEEYFTNSYGSIIVETDNENAKRYLQEEETVLLGTTKAEIFEIGTEKITLEELQTSYEKTMNDIFPQYAKDEKKDVPELPENETKYKANIKIHTEKPQVFIPVMPGTNCEVDVARAFEKAGGKTDTFILRNRDAKELKESVKEIANRIRKAQIVMFPGGFSAGDEPDGSGKFIAAVFRNTLIEEAFEELLHKRDGLVLGICNGFQAIIKLGLVPYGEFKPLTENAPTLTFNTIGRHVSKYVTTKIVSVKSPWLSLCKVGELHNIAISHGEGRLVASKEQVLEWAKNGQIATQYTDLEGKATYDPVYNPNGSVYAIEGLTSKDGRVLGKMGHSERCGTNVAKNITGKKYQPIFESGIKYFKG